MDALRHIFKPAKLLICFMDRHRGDHLMKVSKAAGARGGTIAPGRALVDNRLLQMLSLADVDQDVVFTIMGPEVDAVLPAILATAKKDKKLAGLAILLDVSGMLFRVPGQEQDKPGPQSGPDSAEPLGDHRCCDGGENMQSGYKLINVIVNHGYADDVMAAAREAGAKGGTIMTARGTGTEDDVKFFGISLVPEKEMLMIVAETEAVPAILKAIGQVPDIRQPGGGIVYNMNIERFMPLGRTTDGK